MSEVAVESPAAGQAVSEEAEVVGPAVTDHLELVDPASGPEPAEDAIAEKDWDAWINSFAAAKERTVTLWPPAGPFRRRALELQAEIAATGEDDAELERLRLKLEVLQGEWEAAAVQVQMREISASEAMQAGLAAVTAGFGAKDATPWMVAAACVEPPFTGEQIRQLSLQGQVGAERVMKLVEVFNELHEAPPNVAAMLDGLTATIERLVAGRG